MRFCFAFACVILSINGFAKGKCDSLVIWSDTHKLQESDFKGKVPKNTKWAANTSYILYVEGSVGKSKLPVYIIEARFNRYLSWLKVNTNSVLIHEQLHFDIAELFARKMRKKYHELQVKQERNIKKYNSSFVTLNEECYQMQRDYDRETKHGVNATFQKQWQVAIQNKLKALQEYSL